MSIGFYFKEPAALAPSKRVCLPFEALKPSVDFSSLAIVDGKLTSQSKREMEKSCSSQIEEYNLGRASQKAPRTVLPDRGQSTVI